MKKITFIGVLIAVTSIIALQNTAWSARSGMLEKPIQAAEFTHRDANDWINSTPLSIDDLAGKVVLIDFWTFDCWNCFRSFPWMNAMENRLSGEDFQIIGVHTPEFEHEKIRENIIRKVEEFKLHHPIMIDNDMSYWRAMRNRYWPAFYIMDKQGQIRAIFVGETHELGKQALAIEATIRQLLHN